MRPFHKHVITLQQCWCQVLLFSTMTAALDVIADYLDWHGFTHVRLDGSTGSAERGAIVDQSNDPGATLVALPRP